MSKSAVIDELESVTSGVAAAIDGVENGECRRSRAWTNEGDVASSVAHIRSEPGPQVAGDDAWVTFFVLSAIRFGTIHRSAGSFTSEA